MKISITFKTPDAVSQALHEEVDTGDLDEFEAREMLDQYESELGKWVEHGEYVTIDFDLDEGTATVREAT